MAISCHHQQNNFKPAENALDAGREFIDGCLKGNFEKANFYLLQNKRNDSALAILKKEYDGKDAALKQQLNNASITILSIDDVNEKETIIHYSNSYSKEPKLIKVIKADTNWKIDLSYSINGNF